MRLTHLSIRNLKNHQRTDMDVPKLLALAGENGDGKTAVLSAIKLGVLGHDPAIGRKLEATRQLITVGADQATVGLSFDDGFGIERKCGESMNVKVLPPRGERTLAEMQSRIDEETGSFVVSFDLAAFLALSAEKRRAWLLDILPRSAVDLDQAMWRRWLGFEDAEDFIRRAIDKLWTERVLAKQSVLDGLASAIEYTREAFNAAERDRLAQVKVSEAAERDAIAVARVETPDPAELDRLQIELAAIEQRRGELAERAAEADRAAERIRRRAHDRQVVVMRTQTAERELADAEVRLRAAQRSDDPTLAAALESERVVRQEIARTEAPTDNDLADAREAVEQAHRRSRAQRDAVQWAAEGVAVARGAEQDVRRRLTELEGRDACPLCGTRGDIDALREQLREDLGAKVQATLAAADELEAANTRQRELDAAYERAGEAVLAIEARRGHAQDLVQKLQFVQREIERIRDLNERTVKDIAAQVERHRETLAAARGELERMDAEKLPDPSDADVSAELEDLADRGAGVRDRIRALQEAQRAAGKAEAIRERADAERKQLELLTAKREALYALLNAQQRLRAHVIQQLVGPVESTAAELLGAIDERKRFRFVFEREGKDTFDFGFEEDGIFRSYDAASTGEDAFLAVVLVASLIAAVQPGWRVLLVDNAESIDNERRRWLQIALARLADRFDNVILAGCCKFAEVEGWGVVQVRDVVGALSVAA